jgi:hypothetical protein
VEVVIGDLLQFLATALKLGFADNHRGREISMTKIQFFAQKSNAIHHIIKLIS